MKIGCSIDKDFPFVTKYSRHFYPETWRTYSLSQKKTFIRRELKEISKSLNMTMPNIIFEDLNNAYGEAYYNLKNELCISIDEFELNKNDLKSGSNILATIHHEFKHILQNIDINKPKEIQIGIDHEIVTINKNGKDYVSSLYIRETAQENKLLNSVYVLQPCEYEAFMVGKSIVDSLHIEYNKSRLQIENALNIMTLYFDKKDFVEEIKNSLLTLYDGKPREYSEEVFDLVGRCAICSYIDKEDYGVDRTLLFLNDNYQKELLEKKLQKSQNELFMEEEHEL